MVPCGPNDESGGNCRALLDYHIGFDAGLFVIVAIVLALLILIPLKSTDQ
jgi:hypothetical protein